MYPPLRPYETMMFHVDTLRNGKHVQLYVEVVGQSKRNACLVMYIEVPATTLLLSFASVITRLITTSFCLTNGGVASLRPRDIWKRIQHVI